MNTPFWQGKETGMAANIKVRKCKNTHTNTHSRLSAHITPSFHMHSNYTGFSLPATGIIITQLSHSCDFLSLSLSMTHSCFLSFLPPTLSVTVYLFVLITPALYILSKSQFVTQHLLFFKNLVKCTSNAKLHLGRFF